jgi:tRNA dimethylallyltransferase
LERRVIVLAGPTCSGKTSVSIGLSKHFPSEIISADSRQIYKFLNIGTAKPSPEELNQTRHHLVDCFTPDQEYNASKFEIDSLKLIEEIFNAGKAPVVAGGSGLYIKALVYGIFNSVDADEEFREELHEKRKNFGDEYLYEELKKVDPESALKMLPQNWKRVMRALEVFHLTGVPICKLQENYKRDTGYNFIQFGLNWNRALLYKRIENRVDIMIENGLVEEVKNVLLMGYTKELNSLNTVGYKEIISYLEGEISLERAVELIKRNTRRFAKRQMTWFRKDNRIIWLDINTEEDLQTIPQKVINQISS